MTSLKQFIDNKPLRQRIAEIKTTRWVRFGIVTLLWILLTIWIGSYWLLLVLPLLFDIYITGYIPFTWWKKAKSPTVRFVMSWVDAIVYAVILVYFLFSFIGQNYTIPSSSLEKTLYTGDFLFVNKTIYGPRVPMTPVYFPLVHNELPFGLGKSYTEWPSVKYKRLKGQRSVEAGDIVVFNFPAGDTVMSKVSNPDYYTLVAQLGRELVHKNTERFGEVIWRPVDRRENYVKRCVGLPGQRLQIKDGEIYVDGEKFPTPEFVQFNYFYQGVNGALPVSKFEEYGIPVDDRHQVMVTSSDIQGLRTLGFKVNPDGSVPPIYLSPMTAEMVDRMKADPDIAFVMQRKSDVADMGGVPLFPAAVSEGWTLAEYGGPQGIWIPKKGTSLRMSQRAWDIYSRVIRVYEDNPDAEWRDGALWIDGKPQDTYTFKMDYYFMMGDNRDNSLDSRFWGFVPEDHIVGTPWRVLISFDKDKTLPSSIRWDRIFRTANPDKK